MARICVAPGAVEGNRLTLAGETLRHVRTVLRLREGEELVATDGAGGEFLVRLVRLGRACGEAEVLSRAEPGRESPLETVLAQAVPKGDRFELVLEKAVELGVGAVLPLLTRRTVPAVRRSGGARLERWRRVVEGAVAQSGRTRVPAVLPPRSFEELLADPGPAELKLLLWQGAAAGPGALAVPAPRSVLVAVGPEGGWEDEEAAGALRAGYRAVRLGPRTLRSDTAGLAALALLQQRWGDLG